MPKYTFERPGLSRVDVVTRTSKEVVDGQRVEICRAYGGGCVSVSVSERDAFKQLVGYLDKDVLESKP